MDQVLFIKLISALVYPVGLLVCCLLLSAIFKLFYYQKLAIIFKWLAFLVFIFSTNPMLANKLMADLEQHYPQQEVSSYEKHDAIFVLGGGLRIPLPPATDTQLSSGSDRYWRAVQLFRAGKAPKIVISGGNVFSQAGFQGEAYYAAELLQSWGVPENAIVIETVSRNTEQNLINTFGYFKSKKVKKVLLVTSAYHMPRVMWHISKQEGVLDLEVTPAPADIIVRQQAAPEIFDWLPSAGALNLVTVALHEYYGLWFLQLKAFVSEN